MSIYSIYQNKSLILNTFPVKYSKMNINLNKSLILKTFPAKNHWERISQYLSQFSQFPNPLYRKIIFEKKIKKSCTSLGIWEKVYVPMVISSQSLGIIPSRWEKWLKCSLIFFPSGKGWELCGSFTFSYHILSLFHSLYTVSDTSPRGSWLVVMGTCLSVYDYRNTTRYFNIQ